MSDREEEKTDTKSTPFYPLNFLKGAMTILIVCAALLILTALFPAKLQAPADPMNSPFNIRPDWYFLPAHQLLKYLPSRDFIFGLTWENLGICGITLAYLLLFISPFLDKYEGKAARRRPVFLFAGVVAILAIALLTCLGYFSGGGVALPHLGAR
jgi:quinol-cytochrome oxidoreductase complex cytochrome b subunit